MNPEPIASIIRDAGGPHVSATWKPVGGGCIHEAGRLGDDPAVFVKVNSIAHLPNFECEAEGLRALAATGAVRVPQVVAVGSMDDQQAFIALEWIELRPRDARSDAALGAALARLHAQPAPSCVPRHEFGWPQPNFIGATPQVNTVHEDWPDFFRECRLRPQLARLADANGGAGAWKLDRMLEAGDRLLAGHHPKASLLHGDLWGGNAAATTGGEPVLFDPAVYVGDAETDLAFSRMFGGFSPSFYSAYQEAHPPKAGHEVRARLYNLYHLLNHANLFGGSYIGESRSAIDRLIELGR